MTEQHGVDLLLLDPPYPNKSAERLASNKGRTRPRSGMDSSSSATAPASTSKVRANAAYHTVSDIYDLWALKLPVRAALEAGGPGRKTVVGVWVTNNVGSNRFPQ